MVRIVALLFFACSAEASNITHLRHISSQFLLSDKTGGIVLAARDMSHEIRRRVSYEIGKVEYGWDAGNHCFVIKLPTNKEAISVKPITLQHDSEKESLLSKMSVTSIKDILLGFDTTHNGH